MQVNTVGDVHIMMFFRRLLPLTALLAFIGCDGKIIDASQDNSNGSGIDSGPPPVLDADQHIACVQRINNFRATEGLPPLERWTDAEPCSNEQSGLDANGGGAHGNFGMCGENAQNTCPNWPTTDAVIQGCLQSMWDEGPGEPFSEHGHYINMSSLGYTKVACGFHDGPNGVWANQNFK